jgi:hypothetical protein
LTSLYRQAEARKRLLRACRARPGRRAAEKRDELASPQTIDPHALAPVRGLRCGASYSKGEAGQWFATGAETDESPFL